MHDKKRKNNDTLFNNKNSINQSRNKKGTNDNKKEKKETDNRNKEEIESTDICDEGSDDVFCSIGDPCPEFGMPYWEYNLDSVIVDNFSGNIFEICDVVEERVDCNGNPIITKKIKK